MLSWEVFDSWQHLDQVEGQWSALLGRSETNEPTLTPFWLRTWWNVFGAREGRRLQLVCFRAGDRLVGVAPLVRRCERHWSGLSSRRVEFAGWGGALYDRVCSEYVGFVVESGYEAEICSLLVGLLHADQLGSWDEIDFHRLDGDGPLVQPLREALDAHGLHHSLSTQDVAHYVSLPESWRAYLSDLGPSGRQLIERSRRELERYSGGEYQIRVPRTQDELAIGISVLRHLQSARWLADVGQNGPFDGQSMKSLRRRDLPLQHGGAFGLPTSRRFHDIVMRELFARDALTLTWLTVRGEPLAAICNIVWDGKVSQHQSGRRVGLPEQVRPEVALHVHALRDAIENGCREYDFLGSGESFAKELACAQRSLPRLRVSRSGPGAHLRRGAELCADEIRSAYRHFVDPIFRRGAGPDVGCRE